LKLCSKQYNKKVVLHLIVAPQQSIGWQLNYSTKTRPAGRANQQSMHYLMSMEHDHSTSFSYIYNEEPMSFLTKLQQLFEV